MSKSRKDQGFVVEAVPTGWRDVLMICRKCSRKLNGGFGPDGRATLRQAVRDALRARGQRGQVGLVEVRCLSVCPKKAVTVGRASQPGVLRVVPKGADVAGLLPP